MNVSIRANQSNSTRVKFEEEQIAIMKMKDVLLLCLLGSDSPLWADVGLWINLPGDRNRRTEVRELSETKYQSSAISNEHHLL